MAALKHIFQKALGQDSAAFAFVNAASCDGFALWDSRHTGKQWLAPSIWALLGLAPDDDEEAWLRYLHPDDAALPGKLQAQGIDLERPFVQSLCYCRPADGASLHFLCEGLPINAAGALYWLCRYTRLDTDAQNRHVMEALRSAEERFHFIAAHTREGIMVVEGAEKVLFQSAAYQRMMGYDFSEKNDVAAFYDFIHPDDRGRIAQLVGQAIAQRQGQASFQYRALHKAGHYIWREDHLYFTFDQAGQPKRTVVLARDISDYRSTEAQALQNEALLQAFFDNVPLMVGIVELLPDDTDILMLRSNRAIADYYGTTPERLKGALSSQVGISGPTRRLWHEKFHEAERSGQPVFFEYASSRPDLPHYFEATAVYLGNHFADGKKRYAYIIENVTERRAAAQQLDAAYAQLRQLERFINLSSDGIQVADESGRLVYLNRVASERLGIPQDRVQHYSVRDFEVIFADDAAWDAHVGELEAQGPATINSTNINQLTGEAVPIEVTVRCVSIDGRRYIIAVSRDITERRRAEAALIASERAAQRMAKQYKDILDSQSVFVVKINALDGLYTYINAYYAESYHRRESDLLGTPAVKDILPEDQDKCMAIVKRCFEQPEVPHQVVLKKNTALGDVRASKWEFKGILGAEGQVVEILCVGFDITEQIEALERTKHLLELASEQNFKLKSFAHIVSHNIRSHSANLTGLLNLLDEAESPEESEQYLGMMRISTDKLEETIRNLNEIITVNEHISKPREAKYLAREIRKTLDILAGAIAQYGIQVLMEVDEALSVHVVPAYLDSILLNLLSNAVKYRHPGRPALIRVYAEQQEGQILLSIQDNGLGIDLKRHYNDVFGMYKTFHNNEDARGFGLYITKTQVEAMGGRISVDSQAGFGSTFKVFFYA